MASFSGRARTSLKALVQLGPARVGQYAAYQAGLRSGLYRRMTPVRGDAERLPGDPHLAALPVFKEPSPAGLAELLDPPARRSLLEEAEEIEAGRVRLFGAAAVPLELVPPGPLRHWTETEWGKQHWDGRDIKFVWEPGRFGWVFPLARAYRLTGDSRWAATFWRHAGTFWDANPPNLGPHWASGQEVALRLLAMVFAGQVFADAAPSNPERLARLARQVAAHARRIRPTLVYARAQNNNHLLSEAAGLWTAGLFLPDTPQARAWRKIGWKWLLWGFEHQIRPDGAYLQHSTNYHRFMLQLALWSGHLADAAGERFSDRALERLAAAVGWLAGETDPYSGEMTNLGANDGAYLFPLAPGSFRDARPVVRAASRRFLKEPFFPGGCWDELGRWMGGRGKRPTASREPSGPEMREGSQPGLGQIYSDPPEQFSAGSSWGRLRAVRFSERPSHADQLQVELWWGGMNIVRDAGTYLYNAPPPWENALAGAGVHNNLTVDGQEPMQRAGRFLWLDWDQAGPVTREADPAQGWERVSAARSGYHRLGVGHRRTLERLGSGEWRVLDELWPVKKNTNPGHSIQLHWLLPDWEWSLDGSVLRLRGPEGRIEVSIEAQVSENEHGPVSVSLVRAGERLSGEGAFTEPSGWYSPTYGVKEPALSFVYQAEARLPIRLVTRFVFSVNSE